MYAFDWDKVCWCQWEELQEHGLCTAFTGILLCYGYPIGIYILVHCDSHAIVSLSLVDPFTKLHSVSQLTCVYYLQHMVLSMVVLSIYVWP